MEKRHPKNSLMERASIRLSASPPIAMEVAKEVDFNEILEKHVGGWGRYQWQYLFVFALVT
jgi:hypothetical protein